MISARSTVITRTFVKRCINEVVGFFFILKDLAQLSTGKGIEVVEGHEY